MPVATMTSTHLNVTLHRSIHDISATLWDSVFGEEFITSHTFLALFENSQSVGGDSGWTPAHLTISDDSEVVALIPGYEKTHSYGEYVFDHAWASAYHRYGKQYYPKWINALPFTPVTSKRIGMVKSLTEQDVMRALKEWLSTQAYSSLHCLFLPENTVQTQSGWAHRNSVQFEWTHTGEPDFTAYLDKFTSRKRRSIRKERASIAKQGVTVKRLHGDSLTPEAMEFFYYCYQVTYLKRSGHNGYLTEAFFKQLIQECSKNILLILAYIDDKPIAGALCLFDQDNLYGRYWGALNDISGLHFECCYYQGIEFAIEQGISRFNPGTQGEHKILRGFEPVLCHSLHVLTDQQMHHAVDDFVNREREGVIHYLNECKTLVPFKQNED